MIAVADLAGTGGLGCGVGWCRTVPGIRRVACRPTAGRLGREEVRDSPGLCRPSWCRMGDESILEEPGREGGA